jgi:hypothetical protein
MNTPFTFEVRFIPGENEGRSLPRCRLTADFTVWGTTLKAKLCWPDE